MATTYLDLTNEVLRELNEVVLTSGTFSSATGIQSFVKDAINKSLFDIANVDVIVEGKHNALNDALAQAKAVQQSYKKLYGH